jgi:hypothetical protein
MRRTKAWDRCEPTVDEQRAMETTVSSLTQQQIQAVAAASPKDWEMQRICRQALQGGKAGYKAKQAVVRWIRGIALQAYIARYLDTV